MESARFAFIWTLTEMNCTNLVPADSSKLEGLCESYRNSPLINRIADSVIWKLSPTKKILNASFKQILVVVSCENYIVKVDTPVMHLS